MPQKEAGGARRWPRHSVKSCGSEAGGKIGNSRWHGSSDTCDTTSTHFEQRWGVCGGGGGVCLCVCVAVAVMCVWRWCVTGGGVRVAVVCDLVCGLRVYTCAARRCCESER